MKNSRICLDEWLLLQTLCEHIDKACRFYHELSDIICKHSNAKDESLNRCWIGKRHTLHRTSNLCVQMHWNCHIFVCYLSCLPPQVAYGSDLSIQYGRSIRAESLYLSTRYVINWQELEYAIQFFTIHFIKTINWLEWQTSFPFQFLLTLAIRSNESGEWRCQALQNVQLNWIMIRYLLFGI